MKKYLKYVLCFMLLFGGMVFYQGNSVQAASVYISKQSFTLNYKQSHKLELRNAGGGVSWSSSNPSVATVSSSGVVKSKSMRGTAVITAKCGSGVYTSKVYVYEGKVSFGSQTIGLGASNTGKLRVSIKYKPKWSSSDKKIAKVTGGDGYGASGIITGVKPGTCYVYATIDKKKYKCKVTVIGKKATVKITPDTMPFKGKYALDGVNRNYHYNRYTKNMYTLRSYMTKFENDGGGTIILTKGLYKLCKSVNIPSNVTVQLEDGVEIRKIWSTGVKGMPYQNGMFFVIKPSIVEAVNDEEILGEQIITNYEQYGKGSRSTYLKYKGYRDKLQYPSAAKKYNGSKNVVIKGPKKGKAVMNSNKLFFTLGISVGHCDGLTIQDIDFRNMDGNHFIELNSSRKVVVQRCTFYDDYTTTSYNKGNAVNEGKHKVNDKECINIDVCDPNYAGYENPWAYHDYTGCNNVTVRNCKFKNFIRGVGGHKYTAKPNKNGVWSTQIYNVNIKIYDNSFKNAYANAIEACNWKGVNIYNNNFDGCHNSYADHGKKAKKCVFTGKPCKNHGNHFGEVNPGKEDSKFGTIKEKYNPKLDSAISIFGGGNYNIYKNRFNNCRIGVSAYNLNNTGGGDQYRVSKYSLSDAQIKKIKKENTYKNISSGCSWFFANDIVKLDQSKKAKGYTGKLKIGGKYYKYTTIVAGNKTYLDGTERGNTNKASEFNVYWGTILKAYKAKYFTKKTQMVDADTQMENTSTELIDVTAATTGTEEATEEVTEAVTETSEEVTEEVTTTEDEETSENTFE